MSFVRILVGLFLSICAVAPVSAQSQNADTVNYTFKSGDTLEGFASRFLINIDAARSVQRFNGIKDATKIRPGTVIKVPTSLLKGTPIVATVVAFSGTVAIAGANGSFAPRIGTTVTEGQTLSTGTPGFLTIAISGGSNVSIPSKSRVRIARLRKYLLTGGSDIDLFVEQGRAETAAAPIKDANSRFRMRTPTAVSAVRGTVFRIGYDGPDSSSLTEVVEGAVAVDTGTTLPALVPTGFGAALPKTGKLLQEELLPAPKIINAGAIQADDDVRFRLSAVAGAKGYHTQIARDAGFLEIFAETVSSEPVAAFTNVSDGSFFVRSMAIADSGLEGLAEPFGFRRRLTKVGASEAASATNGNFRINWVKQAAGSTVYRFQLFNDADRAVPMIDEPGLETSGISLTNLPPGSYSWRVGMRQSSADGIVETWSRPQNFTIGE
jgi:hypothetical protein